MTNFFQVVERRTTRFILSGLLGVAVAALVVSTPMLDSSGWNRVLFALAAMGGILACFSMTMLGQVGHLISQPKFEPLRRSGQQANLFRIYFDTICIWLGVMFLAIGSLAIGPNLPLASVTLAAWMIGLLHLSIAAYYFRQVLSS